MSTEFPSEPDRAAVIAGLRQMIDWLEANPGVPINTFQRISYSACTGLSGDQLDDAVAEVDQIGDIGGVRAQQWGPHHVAALWFGPVKYEAAVCWVYGEFSRKTEVAA